MKRIVEGVYQIGLRGVNAFLLETPEGLVLVDTGFPGRESPLLTAIDRLGPEPRKLSHIILTHAHPDHVGSLAALVRATGAQTWMHGDDVAITERGHGMRPIHPSPGLLPKLLFAAMQRMESTWEGARIDHRIQDGDVLPFGSLQVIHVPGHCAGQVALLWPERRVLFAADACMNILALRPPLVNEDAALGRRSLARLAQASFDTACFGHGGAIVSGADRRFRQAFGANQIEQG